MTRDVIYKHALKNAFDHGKAESQAVLKKVLAENPEYRRRAREVLPLVTEIVKEVNTLQINEIEKRLEKYEFKIREGIKGGLEGLPNPKKVRLRFAPNPSGPLHLGHCRAAILNDEYARMYKGRLILRIEDTDPRRVDPDAYDMIRGDLKWLGVDWAEEVIQSERLEIYYDYAKKLLEMGSAYVCKCDAKDFKALREAMESCPCRGSSTEGNLRDFERMFNEYREGEVVVRIKTDLAHENPSIREFPIMRVVDKEHPLVGPKKVYPLYNFSVTVDDYLHGITHVLRGKDHIINTEKQKIIYSYFGWKSPIFIHYGLLKIGGVELSTSGISRGIKEGLYSGWGDARLGTLQAMRKRGFQPKAIRKAIIDVGVKSTDISFSWKNLFAYNRQIIEPKAKRYFFVAGPRSIKIKPKNKIKKAYFAPLHPDNPEMGERELKFDFDALTASTYIPRKDFEKLRKGDIIRLMNAFNVKIKEMKKEGVSAEFHSEEIEEARKIKAPLIQWASQIAVKVTMPDGGVEEGYAESDLKNAGVGDIVQFERFGFVRIDKMGKKGKEVLAYFTHK